MKLHCLSFTLFILLASASLLFAESITITTYYPSPYGSYRELRSTRMAIGDNYINSGSYSWDTGTINTNADLVVEGNVGIGTTTPNAKLEIEGGGIAVGRVGAVSGTEGGRRSIQITSDTRYGGTYDDHTGSLIYTTMPGGWGTSQLEIRHSTDWVTYASTPDMVIGSKVGIGVTSPSYQLQLSTDSAAKPSTTTWTTTSDIRVKKDIRPYTNGLEIIRRVNPVWFKYNGKGGFAEDGQDHIGVIAQEIQKVAPYTVNAFKTKLNPEDKEDTELLNFNPHALIFDLINSVKELDANVTQLALENQELKKEIEILKAKTQPSF